MCVRVFNVYISFLIIVPDGPLDIVFVLGSLGNNAMFSKQVDVTKDLLDNYEVSTTGTHVGLLTYGKDPSLVLSLKDGVNSQIVSAYLNQLQNPNDGDDLHKALAYLHSTVFTAQNGARVGIPKRLVLYLDKNIESGKLIDVQMKVNELQKVGIKVYVIGLGKDIDQGSLTDLFDTFFFAEVIQTLKRMIIPIVTSIKKSKFILHDYGILGTSLINHINTEVFSNVIIMQV